MISCDQPLKARLGVSIAAGRYSSPLFVLVQSDYSYTGFLPHHPAPPVGPWTQTSVVDPSGKNGDSAFGSISLSRQGSDEFHSALKAIEAYLARPRDGTPFEPKLDPLSRQ